jgi:hypothetical protein
MRKQAGQRVWYLNGNDIKEGSISSRAVPKFIIHDGGRIVEVPVKQTFSSKEELESNIRKSKISRIRANIHAHQVAIRDCKKQIRELYR